MTPEEHVERIIKEFAYMGKDSPPHFWFEGDTDEVREFLLTELRAAVAEEREACALLIEELERRLRVPWLASGKTLARAIRARATSPPSPHA
jgi:hypothetical protein